MGMIAHATTNRDRYGLPSIRRAVSPRTPCETRPIPCSFTIFELSAPAGPPSPPRGRISRPSRLWNCRLDMTRGKPSAAQLDLADAMLGNLGPQDVFTASGEDARNYGGLQGLPEVARPLRGPPRGAAAAGRGGREFEPLR